MPKALEICHIGGIVCSLKDMHCVCDQWRGRISLVEKAIVRPYKEIGFLVYEFQQHPYFKHVRYSAQNCMAWHINQGQFTSHSEDKVSLLLLLTNAKQPVLEYKHITWAINVNLSHIISTPRDCYFEILVNNEIWIPRCSLSRCTNCCCQLMHLLGWDCVCHCRWAIWRIILPSNQE